MEVPYRIAPHRAARSRAYSVRRGIETGAGLVPSGARARRGVMRLRGKTAIVTGGGSGFGAGIARRFSVEGAEVMVADVAAGAASDVAAEIGGVAQEVDVAS